MLCNNIEIFRGKGNSDRNALPEMRTNVMYRTPGNATEMKEKFLDRAELKVCTVRDGDACQVFVEFEPLLA